MLWILVGLGLLLCAIMAVTKSPKKENPFKGSVLDEPNDGDLLKQGPGELGSGLKNMPNPYEQYQKPKRGRPRKKV